MNKKFPIVKFEEWLLTPKGKRCMSMKGITEEYLKNRLWWAYHSGIQSGDVQYSECGDILRLVLERHGKKFPRSLRNRIEYIIKEHESEYLTP